MKYTPPTTDDLLRLKERLGKTQSQMAELAGLTQGSQWRKYTGGKQPRSMGIHMLFYLAAQEVLTSEEYNRVLRRMRDIGAEIE